MQMMIRFVSCCALVAACSSTPSTPDGGGLDASVDGAQQPDVDAAPEAAACALDTCGTSCVDLQSDPNHCGTCDNSCGDGVVLCCGGHCAANNESALVQKEYTNAVVVDATNIYFGGDYLKGVQVLPKIGPKPVPLAINIGSVQRLAVDATNVYAATAGGGVYALPIATSDGGAPAPLVPSVDSRALAIDDTSVYYGAETVGLCKIAKTGGSPSTLDAADGIFAAASDGAFVYYGWYAAGKYELRKIATSGGSPATLRAAFDGVLTVSNGTLLWTESTSNGSVWYVYAMPTSGGTPRIVAGGAAGATDITADSKYVYWVSSTTSRVSRALLSGGAVEVVANLQSNPHAIAVDDAWIYWGNYTDSSGSLLEACK